jgi:hypothetical protein
MKTPSTRRRTIPKKYYRKFGEHWKNVVLIGEANFWKPHWTRDAPLSVRLERLDFEKELVLWIVWWIEAFNKLERGKPVDRSSEPPTPEGMREQKGWNICYRLEGDESSRRWNFWMMIWGPESLDDDNEAVSIPRFKGVRTEFEWHADNLFSGEVTSPSVRFFRKYIRDDPETAFDDWVRMRVECGARPPGARF